MLIIAENLNTSRKKIKPLVEEQNGPAIQEIAKSCEAAGASYIDVNCGTFVTKEIELLSWMVDTVQDAVSIPVSVDTPSPEAAAAALAKCKGKPFLNSISGESIRFEPYLELVKEFKPKVVTLVLDDKGMPETVEDRVANGTRMVETMTSAGVPPEDIYLDPLVYPISSDTKNGMILFETVKQFTERFPEVNTVCGLSNVSHGLPVRKIINQAFQVMLITAGIKAAIINPLDKYHMALIYATKALTDQDEYCMEYITAQREGKLEV